MPKSKPDQVIVHRIELQATERDILSGLSTAVMFKQIADPIVKLLNDVTGTVTFLTLLAASGIFLGVTFNFIYDVVSAKDPLEQFLTQLEEAKERAEIVGGAAKRGPLWGLIDMLEYAYGINLPDFGGGFENVASTSSSPFGPNPDWNDPTDLYLNLISGTPTSPADLWGSNTGDPGQVTGTW